MTTLVIGDLHLLSDGNPAAAQSLSALLRAEPDADVVFAGDALDLAAERTTSPADAIRRSMGSAPELCRALAERAARGVRTTFVAGNHDAAVATDWGLDAL